MPGGLLELPGGRGTGPLALELGGFAQSICVMVTY